MIIPASLIAAPLFAAAAATLPAAYRGNWSTDVSACGGEDTNGVQIAADAIAFYEAAGSVRSVSTDAKGASARVDFKGEGETWKEVVRLRPLPDNRLELTALGATAIYERCPAAEAR